jgi:hypothetical protein
MWRFWNAASIVDLRQRRDEQDHVPGLLDGHLVLDCLLSPAVDLSVRVRIRAEIVRSERELPRARRRVLEHRNQHAARKLGAEQEETAATSGR